MPVRAGAALRLRLRLHLPLLIALLSGCSAAPRRPDASDGRGDPRLTALLLNGGDTPSTNYLSHARHLEGMRERLLARGLREDRAFLFASDGYDPTPDLAVRHAPASPTAWLLEETSLDGSLVWPLRRHNSRLPGPLEPARRAQLAAWFEQSSAHLRAGDTLLLFVTDHGQRGSPPGDGRIALWMGESVSVTELAAWLSLLPPGVRVVTVMSQCFSGAFAGLAVDPSGRLRRPSTCGFFATTAERPAYGCFPESASGDAAARDVGYAFELIRALPDARTIDEAHVSAVLHDRTPDVPVRTSDVFLAEVVKRAAAGAGLSTDDFVDDRLAEALRGATAPDAAVQSRQEAWVLQHLAAGFGLDPAWRAATVSEEEERLARLVQRLTGFASSWRAAQGELAQANLEAFLAAEPAWRNRLSPRRLRAITLAALGDVEGAFLTRLAGFTGQRADRLELLRSGRWHKVMSERAAFRSETRRAGLLRLRTSATSLVGRALVARAGAAWERQQLAELIACEQAALPRAPAGRAGPRPPPEPLPSLESEEALARKLTPAWLGARLEPLAAPAGSRPEVAPGVRRVAQVEAGSPAQAAGLRPGDVLLGPRGGPPPDDGALDLVLTGLARDRPQEIDLLREGRRHTVSVSLVEPPLAPLRPRLPAAGRTALAGLVAQRGSLAALAGGPYLLFFWATWCEPCKRSLPELLTIEQRLGLPVIAVAMEPAETVADFLAARSGGFPARVALDGDGQLHQALEVEGYPTFLLVDAAGRVGHRSQGYQPAVGLYRRVAAAIDRDPAAAPRTAQ